MNTNQFHILLDEYIKEMIYKLRADNSGYYKTDKILPFAKGLGSDINEMIHEHLVAVCESEFSGFYDEDDISGLYFEIKQALIDELEFDYL